MTSTVKAALPCDVFSASGSWVCEDPVPNGKNGRSALVWKGSQKMERPKVQLCSPEETCYEVVEVVNGSNGGAYGYMEVRPSTQAQYALLAQLDQYALDQAGTKCQEWFGKVLSADTIRSMYRPLVSDGGCVRLRFSLGTCNVWCVQPGGREYTDSCFNDIAAGCRVLPCVTVNGIYFKTRVMGLSLTCSDVLLYPSKSWPFHVSRPMSRGECPTGLPEHEDASLEVQSALPTLAPSLPQVVGSEVSTR